MMFCFFINNYFLPLPRLPFRGRGGDRVFMRVQPFPFLVVKKTNYSAPGGGGGGGEGYILYLICGINKPVPRCPPRTYFPEFRYRHRHDLKRTATRDA